MSLLSSILVSFVAIVHLYILVLEMFLWSTPRGRRAFGLKPDFAQKTKSLAANQGLYNGFLSAGLLWGLLHPDGNVGMQIQIFFLACVTIAGIFGAVIVKPRILLVQSVPAIAAVGAVIFT